MKARPHMVTMVLLALVIGFGSLTTVGVSRAQDAPASEVLFSVDLADGEYPVAPAFVRLLRITLQPGASSPLHTHPGPEFGLIEQGRLTVQVSGPALLQAVGDDATPTPFGSAPMNTEFEMAPGDVIAYLPQTPMTFRNAQEDPVAILAAVLLPAGNQHPPGITYLEGQPSASAFEGVLPEILGDGIATILPRGGLTVRLERIVLGPGEPIPASNDPVLLSLERGTLDFTVIGGKVQVSRTATPGPQPDTAPQTDVRLSKGDGVFFPIGLKEVDRSRADGELVLLRMTLVASEASGVPTPTEAGMGEIAILVGDEPDLPPVDGTPTADGTPTVDETPAPEQPTEIGPGAMVESLAEGVNVRSGPGTSFQIVTQVFTGDRMRITGESTEADGFTWWPIELESDPSVTGYIAEDFIGLVDDR